MREVSSELQARIDEAEEAFRKGESIVCRTPEDLERFFDSL